MNNKGWFIVWLCLFIIVTHYTYAQTNIGASYSIQRLSINSSQSDFSPILFDNTLLFTSNRDDDLGIIHISENKDIPFFKLYSVLWGKDKIGKPQKLGGDVNTKFSEGAFSVASDKSTLYLTRNVLYTDPKTQRSKAHFSIFSTSYKDGVCGKIEPFAHNKPPFSVAHPTLSPNGNVLVFASNVPDGMGGTDLYVSYLKDGKWSKPINLGNKINTRKNESYPFLAADGTLYFASDGHKGIGGMDIFSANYANFEWGNPQNLGPPFNSSKDDFSYFQSTEPGSGFFSSNREKGGADDDIYSFARSPYSFNNCDTLKNVDYCRTFYEENTMNTDSLPLIYEWDFGNGIKKRGAEATHCFEKPGKYTVNLNIVDLITNQLFMNEATYELEVAPIQGPYFSVPDTLVLAKPVFLNAEKSRIEKGKIIEYHWDLGDGSLLESISLPHTFELSGDYNIKLGIVYFDSTTNKEGSKCAVKPVHVQSSVSKATYSKPIYTIRDKSGNEYKIQLATSETKLDINADYFKEIGTVEEYFDRGIFGYTVGNYDRPEKSYPELKKIRSRGFKEAIVIAMKNKKVVSGYDSSFFIKPPKNFRLIRVVSLKGTVTNSEGIPVACTVRLEDLPTGTPLNEFTSDSIDGSYQIDLPIEKSYAYYVEKQGYFPVSNFVDLTKSNDLVQIKSDIKIYAVDKIITDSLILRINNIFFEKDSDILRPESLLELKRLKRFLNLHPNIAVEIAGHTDNNGDKYSKLILSKKRADNIKNYLVQEGIPEKNIFTKGFGELKPITLNPRNKEINNRIELRLFR